MSISAYFLSIMKDERRSADAVVFGLFLTILSFFYCAAVGLASWMYKTGIKRSYKMDVPVVSVGNITLGGTGKTPFVIYLADYFSGKGVKAGILTRGYGGDETVLMKETLPDTAVYAGKNRLDNARAAVNDGCKLLILDDGFQHRRIKRDLDIVLLDKNKPFGNGHIFPRGVLRESTDALKRADICIFTKIDRKKCSGEATSSVCTACRGEMPAGSTAVSGVHKPVFFTDASNTFYPLESVRGKKVCLVAGIADPIYFEEMVYGLGCDIKKTFFFDDHYAYAQCDVDAIGEVCEKQGIEKIIMTHKDFVKFRKLDCLKIENKILVLMVKFAVTEGKESLFARLDSVIFC
ncbi:MAG: tetraacyldisaccharide 4'-kinase [Candidatus Omnitrophica bacterium]|nr:tetraacyldisaccharide 4'-kinase [Candidatus Omnitrophota bacterium]